MIKTLSAFKFIPVIVIAGAFLFREHLADFAYFLLWWAAMASLGIIFLPLADLVFPGFKCRGYMFARVLALAVAGWFMWVMSSAGILPFRAWACYLTVIIFFAVNLLINRKTGTYARYIRDEDLFKSSLNKESLFAALLLFWAVLRAYRPAIDDLEKFMEFGFINSILRNDWMPAPDMWLSGESINYYYLGHFFSAFLTRLTNIPPAIMYNLMMSSLFAISFMLAYSIGSFFVQLYIDNAHDIDSKHRQTAKIAGGLVSGAAVTLAGNLHTIIYAVLFPQRNVLDYYWFPNATRYIGFNPEVPGDKTIHEFPHYSYVVSDLHAHVINMIFVLTAIAVICALTVHMLRLSRDGICSSTHVWRRPGFIILMLLIGLFMGMNFWDYPIYIVVTGAMLLYVNLKIYDFGLKSIYMTVLETGAVAVAAVILTLPFHLTFDSMGTAISFTSHRSMIHQLLVLWGYQLFFGIALIFLMSARYRRITAAVSGKKGKKQGKTRTRAVQKLQSADAELFVSPSESEPKYAFYRYIDIANPADAMALIIFICATGLFLIPEVIFVVDIYDSQPRANTMFKLGYQAFILFGLGVGYTMVRLILEDSKIYRTKIKLRAAAVILLGSALIYPFYAIPQWYGNREFQGLDGTVYLKSELRSYDDADGETHWLSFADDYELIQYINGNIKGSPVLVEAMGDSYTMNGRISVNTGLPNILNWYYHEILWRNSDYVMVNKRRNDTHSIYTSGDINAVREVLDKYDVSYIVVGQPERLRYPELDEQLLMSLGDIVFHSNDLYMIEVR